MIPSHAPAGHSESEDPREAVQTATRMFVSGDLDRREYEGFLLKSGVQLHGESEVQKLIVSHEKVGDGKFLSLSRALNREWGGA